MHKIIKMKTLFISVFTSVVAILILPISALAVTCTANTGGGTWNVPTAWIGCAGGGGTPANTPGPSDDVVIGGGNTITVPGATFLARSINMSNGGALLGGGGGAKVVVGGGPASVLNAGSFGISITNMELEIASGHTLQLPQLAERSR
jgi:hypothetical protein